MTVPNCPAWQCQPGFQTRNCYCVEVCKKPWPDCTGCEGTGLIGTVPIGVYYVAREKANMPEHRGDPRFDPRAFTRVGKTHKSEDEPTKEPKAVFAAAILAVAVVTIALLVRAYL